MNAKTKARPRYRCVYGTRSRRYVPYFQKPALFVVCVPPPLASEKSVLKIDQGGVLGENRLWKSTKGTCYLTYYTQFIKSRSAFVFCQGVLRYRFFASGHDPAGLSHLGIAWDGIGRDTVILAGPRDYRDTVILAGPRDYPESCEIPWEFSKR